MPTVPATFRAWIAPSVLCGTTLFAALAAHSNTGGEPTPGALHTTSVTAMTATDGSTASALCSYNESTPVVVGNNQSMTSTATWTCSGTQRNLTGNGVPNHSTGTFPNSNDPNSLSAQNVSAAMPLSPAIAASTTQVSHVIGYALNSVKFDPATAGGCTVTNGQTSCVMLNYTGSWNLEALGQTAFNFGADSSNAHTQPDGSYHYHGMPTGLMTALGKGQAPTLVGWALDGYPIYGRYGYTTAMDATSAVKVLKSSYQLKTTPDSGRPSVSSYPMGTFSEDYQYVAGSGDLDDCNGRVDVTPEFPNGIYHYYTTDTYPFVQRCVKGTPFNSTTTPTGSFTATTNAAGYISLQSIAGAIDVASTDVGKAGELFVAAQLPNNTLFFLANTGWTTNVVPYSSGTLQSASGTIELTGGAIDLTSLKGTKVLMGYGRGSNTSTAVTDLLNNKLYTTVYTIQ